MPWPRPQRLPGKKEMFEIDLPIFFKVIFQVINREICRRSRALPAAGEIFGEGGANRTIRLVNETVFFPMDYMLSFASKQGDSDAPGALPRRCGDPGWDRDCIGKL